MVLLRSGFNGCSPVDRIDKPSWRAKLAGTWLLLKSSELSLVLLLPYLV